MKPLLRMNRSQHSAIFSPTGGGKGVSIAVPFLLDCGDESAFVFDQKAELSRITMNRRREMGHEIVLLDPYGMVGKSDSLNPLDQIRAEDRHAIDECNDLAKAIVIRTGKETEPYWNDASEFVIGAVSAVVVGYGSVSDGTRSLNTVRDIISDPEKLEQATKLMLESELWDGMLRPLGGQLLHLVDRERASVLSAALRHLRFLGTPAIRECTSSTSFDISAIRDKMTIYQIVSPERSQAGLSRMWLSAILREVVRGGLQENKKVHFVLDESASLGHLDCIDNALDKGRGFGIRLQFYFQSVGQLKKCFPEGQEQTLLSNTSQVFFAVNDNGSAELVSNRLGDETIIVDSGGTNSGGNRSQSFNNMSSGTSHGRNTGWQQTARKLLKPEEVMALDPRTAITFTPGLPPIMTRLMRYYEEPDFNGTSGFKKKISAFRRFLGALVICGASLLLAAILTLMAIDELHSKEKSNVRNGEATFRLP